MFRDQKKSKDEMKLEAEIPCHTLTSIGRWVTHGVPGGHFLTAVLTNDLKEAVGRADLDNRRALCDIVTYLYNYVPVGCWGSPQKTKEWKEKFCGKQGD